ncbi:unnamed protein product [Prunus brigantina]
MPQELLRKVLLRTKSLTAKDHIRQTFWLAFDIMENHDKAQLQSFLKTLPPVEFCCVYGSSLHPNNPGSAKSTMVDCILGVSNPRHWHSENLTLNNDHYSSWMVLLGGARLITDVADETDVGVHFNPFVS